MGTKLMFLIHSKFGLHVKQVFVARLILESDHFDWVQFDLVKRALIIVSH